MIKNTCIVTKNHGKSTTLISNFDLNNDALLLLRTNAGLCDGMEKTCVWFALLDQFVYYCKLNKLYIQKPEYLLLTIVGAKLFGGTKHWREDYEARLLEEDAGKKATLHPTVRYYRALVKHLGIPQEHDVKLITPELKPFFVYPDMVDTRVHLALLIPTSTGKSASISVLRNVCSSIGVFVDELPTPTTAKLVGSAKDIKGKLGYEVNVPALLDTDILVIDEARDMFIQSKFSTESKNLAILRRVLDNYTKSVISPYSAASTGRIYRFYGRSTIILACYLTDELNVAIREGTLQRFLVYSPTISKEYLVNTNKALNDPIQIKGKTIDGTPLHLVAEKSRVLKSISAIINGRVDAVRDRADNQDYWFLKYDVDEKIKEEVIGDFYYNLLNTKYPPDENLAEFSRRSFDIRAQEMALKIACIISVINGGSGHTITRDELIYARDLVYNNIEEVLVNLLETKLPRDSQIMQIVKIIHDSFRDKDAMIQTKLNLARTEERRQEILQQVKDGKFTYGLTSKDVVELIMKSYEGISDSYAHKLAYKVSKFLILERQIKSRAWTATGVKQDTVEQMG